MKRTKKQKVEEFLDLLLKALPILIAIFFVGSLAFNVAYFRALKLNWYMFLSLSDYYEGSLFAILNLFLIGFIALGLHALQPQGIKLIKRLFFDLNKIKLLLLVLKQCLLLEWKMLLIRQRMRFLSNIPFDIKRTYLQEIRDSKILHKKIFILLKKFLWNVVKILFVLLCGVCWFGAILYLIYITNWPILLIIILAYIQLFIIKKNHKHLSLLVQCFALFALYLTCMWDLGTYLAQERSGYDVLSIRQFLNQEPSLARIAEKDYVLVRGLTRGIVVKDQDEILFFKWEDVKFLHKQRNEKQGKVDDKK